MPGEAHLLPSDLCSHMCGKGGKPCCWTGGALEASSRLWALSDFVGVVPFTLRVTPNPHGGNVSQGQITPSSLPSFRGSLFSQAVMLLWRVGLLFP